MSQNILLQLRCMSKCGPIEGPWVRRSKLWTHNYGPTFGFLFWDYFEMVPIEGPNNGSIIRDQILVPFLRPNSGPWIWGPNLGPLEGP